MYSAAVAGETPRSVSIGTRWAITLVMPMPTSMNETRMSQKLRVRAASRQVNPVTAGADLFPPSPL